ncbi:DUF6164 family protein [Rhodanobacter soli]
MIPYWHNAAGGLGGGYHGGMSKLLMNLRDVPGDEADDVRAMLDAQGIAYYETRPSIWGISAGGIWITEDAAFADARRAMDDYQQQRATRARAEYAAAKRAGTAATFITLLRADPLRVVMSLLGILFALALVTLPFFLLRG